MAEVEPAIRGGTSTNGKKAEITVQGGVAPDPTQFLEKGVNIPISLMDDVPQLRTRLQALKIYKKMLRGDSQTRTTIRACAIPILGADWFVEPGGESEKDKDAKEFVEYNLFEGMTSTWIKTLEHIAKFMSD